MIKGMSRSQEDFGMAERPRDAARRLRKQARDMGRELGEEARRTAMDQANDAIARALEPLTPERRRAMTRDHLLEAAAIIFARDGFYGASLDDIAATAGFTKGAVYSNFKSKEDLLLALMDKHISQQFDDIVGALDTEARTQEEQLPRIAKTVVNHLWDDDWTMLWLEFVLYAARNPEAKGKIRNLTRKAREQVVDLIEKEYSHTGKEPKYSPEQVAIITTAMFDGIGMYHLIEPGLTDDETIRTLLQMLYDAMGVEEDAVSDLSVLKDSVGDSSAG
jgi:AcrR family transcriptional regulator